MISSLREAATLGSSWRIEPAAAFRISEYEKVEAVARKFIEGVKTGKSEILKGIFHEKACIFGRLNKDTTEEGSITSLKMELIKLVLAKMIMLPELIS